MTLINDLYAKHGSALNEAQSEAVAEYLRCAQAGIDFAYPKGMSEVDAQSAFVLFEREFSATPVALFGQDVASLAHTRLHIYRACHSQGSGYVPGEEIFSARISEKSLTEAMLLSNKGEAAPITVTRLGSLEIADRERSQSKSQLAAQSLSVDNERAAKGALAAARDVMVEGLSRSTPELKEAVASIGYKIRDLSSTKFALERHVDVMSATRSEVLTEAAHAALHADKIIAALGSKTPLLPPPTPIDWEEAAATHPLVNAMLDPLPLDLREGLRTLIICDIELMAQRHPKLSGWISHDEGQRVVNFPTPRDRGVALGLCETRKQDGDRIGELTNIWNWAFNPYLQKSREQRNPTQATLSVSQRDGWCGNIHSALPPSEGSSFSISICSAWEHHEHGGVRIRSAHMPVVEIEIVAEDLMTSLRGHPQGLPVPCSLRALAGEWRPQADRPKHEISADIDEMALKISSLSEVKDLDAAFASLSELATAKRTGKAWRTQVMTALDDVEAALEAARHRIEQELSVGRGRIDEHVIKSAQAIMTSIAEHLPKEALDLLKLTANDS